MSPKSVASGDIEADLVREQRRILEGMNDTYADATLLVARILGGRREATEARAVDVRPDGVELTATDTTGAHDTWVPFANPIGHVDDIWAEFFALVVRARAEADEDGTTSVEAILARSAGYRTFFATVTAVSDLGPHLREVTVRGGDLADGFAPVGPDTFLYLLLPPPGRSELTIDATFSWEGVRAMAPEDQPVGAYYTLRRWRPADAEIDLWMVLHGDTGPASAWATRARPGDPVALWGPRTSWEPPPETDSFLLVADDTGLPAVAVILETLPADVPVEVVLEVGDATDQVPLPHRPDTRVHWLHRGDAAAGTTSGLADAVRALAPMEGTPYAWGGAESRAMTAVRRHVRDTWGLSREQVALVGYWRHRDHVEDV